MSGRTKGPWYAKPSGGYQTHGQFLVISEDHGTTVAVIYGGPDGNGEADARRIVEACNAHDGLRAENERLRDALVGVMGWYNMTDVAALMSDKGEQAEYHRTIMQARAALGKAGM